MREILFRGKRVDNGELVFGDFRHIFHGEYRTHIVDNSNGLNNGVCGFEVDPSTVGQFTGLTDKNGVKIFEGDIIKHTQVYLHGTVKSIGYVKWSTAYACWLAGGYTNGRADMFLGDQSYKLEVLGNIYDNPELLEVNGNE